MNSIAFDVENEKVFSRRVQKFFSAYQVSGILKQCGAYSLEYFADTDDISIINNTLQIKPIASFCGLSVIEITAK